MGRYPVRALVRLNAEKPAVVRREHAEDPFRPQVTLVRDSQGNAFENDMLTHTWERDARGDSPLAIVEAVDPQADIDSLDCIANVGHRPG